MEKVVEFISSHVPEPQFGPAALPARDSGGRGLLCLAVVPPRQRRGTPSGPGSSSRQLHVSRSVTCTVYILNKQKFFFFGILGSRSILTFFVLWKTLLVPIVPFMQNFMSRGVLAVQYSGASRREVEWWGHRVPDRQLILGSGDQAGSQSLLGRACVPRSQHADLAKSVLLS